VDPEGFARGYALADDFMARENARLPLNQRPPEERNAFFARYEQMVLQGAGASVSVDLAGRIFARVRQLPYDLALFDDVVAGLERLRGRGLTLGLLSNLPQAGQELARALGLSPYLDFVLTSQEAGAEKPHPLIFQKALERAAVAPAEAVHVGDQYSADVLGARGAGIRAVLMDRYATLEQALDCPLVHSMPELLDLLLPAD
jgi:putative hydrolase of the HAD superfamily